MIDREKVIDRLEMAVMQMHGPGRYTPEDVDELEMAGWDALALLREQEGVKPIGGYGCYICGVCKNPLTSVSQKFCSVCGKAVKWDD